MSTAASTTPEEVSAGPGGPSGPIGRPCRRTAAPVRGSVLAALDRLGDRGASVARGPIGDPSGRIVTLARSGVTLTAPVDLGGIGHRGPVVECGSGRSVGRGEPLAVVDVVDGAIATSSVRLRRWVAADGRPVHHLVDPSTGEPGGHGLLAVTVALADPAWAEVWSKALFLAGPTVIGPEARERGLAAW